MSRETELLTKLLKTYHLNVEERQELPGRVVRASTAKELINSELVSIGWFPGSEQKPIGNAGGE